MLEEYFSSFRGGIIGNILPSKLSGKNILYADWTASGRLYRPIEEFLTNEIGPYVANPHTETTETGQFITQAYRHARTHIKKHVGANENDVLICTGAGATSAINKLQRVMGFAKKQTPHQSNWLSKISRLWRAPKHKARPVVFVTHMEHHSNHTSWNTLDVNVVVLNRAPDGQPCVRDLRQKLKEYESAPLKVGAFTACSNVTGIKTDIHLLASIMHQAGGLCFADYACSAPYVDINMHPDDPMQQLDAIYFSPHKFLGGPGSCGVLVFNQALYKLNSTAPDKPGGGTVLWTNPWGEQAFYQDIETREDGGTPAFLQTIKAAKAMELKEQMGTTKIELRETHLRKKLFAGLNGIPGLKILEPNIKNRLCIVSFYVEGLHHNLIVRLLNDKFAVQARGGCSCAGTYGHVLLNVDKAQSKAIVEQVNQGDLSHKPGWVRVSLHPTNSNADADYLISSIEQVVMNAEQWQKEYEFCPSKGDFLKLRAAVTQDNMVA